jgi:K+ transporter
VYATTGTLFLQAINPYYLYRFFTSGVSADLAWRSTASIFLCITGAEASYADMGHFTRKSIRVSPFMLRLCPDFRAPVVR